MGAFTKNLALRRWWRKREGWARDSAGIDGARFRAFGSDLQVIVSVACELDGCRWVHVSVSRPHTLPSYGQLCRVKRDFIGAHRKAIQVFAPESEHVNIHDYCLHLWHCIDGDALPDFARGGPSI